MKDHIPDPGDLLPVNQATLDDMIRKHAMFLEGRTGGARCILTYRNLSHLNFNQKDLRQADFTGSLFIEANLSKGRFENACFFACDLRNANMKQGNFSRADFRGAYVAGANLVGADMAEVDLREGKIMKRGAQGELVDRKRSGGIDAKTIFTGARLSETNMTGAHAKSADFSDADLTGVILNDADLTGTNFHGANLADADLTGCNLTNANMRSSIISGAIMDQTEKQGLILDNAITEDDMGSKLENLGQSLPELLEEHTLWVATAGRSGRQLDLSGYDLRDVLDLKRFPFTAIRAIGSNFLNQDLRGSEMQSAVFDRSDFRDCKLQDADLRGSTFKYAQMTRADLSHAKLCPLKFKNPDGTWRLQRVDLSGASLRYSSLREADLRDCVMMGVD
ncbi:MAG: pentapeptide repeat-containing protein [Alphaproteobacteria bacterium]